MNDTFKANNMSLGFGIVVLFLLFSSFFYIFSFRLSHFCMYASERFAVIFLVSCMSLCCCWLVRAHFIQFICSVGFPLCPSGPCKPKVFFADGLRLGRDTFICSTNSPANKRSREPIPISQTDSNPLNSFGPDWMVVFIILYTYIFKYPRT